MRRFDGKKDPMRLVALEHQVQMSGEWYNGFLPYRKTTLTYAKKIEEPFEVDTLEGLHTGKAGDYLAIGAHGEMYPIDAAVFEDTYEALDK